MVKSSLKRQSLMYENLQSIRDNFDINELSEQIKKRGDKIKLAKTFGIDRAALCRAISEAKILSIFPNIEKSKSVPLSKLKTYKEKVLFSEKYNINKLEVRTINRLIKKWRRLLEDNPRTLLTDKQHDLIIGTVLGDGNIRQRDKNCSFRVGHTKKQEKYLYWKYSLFREFTKLSPNWNIRKLNDHIIKTLEFSTFTHQIFNYYRRLFYKNDRKHVTREILNMLTPRSLAIWVCDDGCFEKRQGYIIFCTNSYSLEEHEIIKKYFEEIWGLSPTIGFRDKKYYYLRFKQDDTKKLIKIIKPYIPSSMKYKIGEENE